MGAGGGKRIHVHIPICHKRMGSVVPPGGQGILGCRGDFRSLDNALLGILGTVLSGWFSDKLFKGDRKIPALLFGILNSLALVLFLYGGNAMWVNVLSMVLFGIAIGVLICFLGGLMAVDIVPRKATGAALGVVGIASYIAAGIQDVASGWLIDSHITVATDGAKHYDFGPVALFWIAASVISFLLPLMNRKQKTEA